jgi:hypothetical protein
MQMLVTIDAPDLRADTVLTDFFDRAWTAQGGEVLSAGDVLARLLEGRKTFGQGQEDASEGFDLLMDKLGPRAASVFRSTWRTDVFCDTCKVLVSSGKADHSRIIVERNYVPLDGKGLQGFVNGNMTIFDGYRCPKCKRETKGANVSRMIAPPEAMVITFNKFMGKWSMGAYEERLVVRGHEYRLVACVRHLGGQEGGHYEAICARKDGYYWLNDARQARVPAIAATPEDYILLYTREPRADMLLGAQAEKIEKKRR